MTMNTLLKATLHYDPITGHFTYLKDGIKWKRGQRAGGVGSHGYRQISFDGKRWLEHRLAWLYMTGEVPPMGIDHRNHDKTCNAWKNLRLATRSQNAANKVNPTKGATYNAQRGKWLSRIVLQGKWIFLGWFDTYEEAKSHYNEFSELVHGEFCCN